MSDENELTPEIEAALRNIPAGNPTLRDQHIAAALGELAPVATTKRRNLFAAAAAVVVLAGVGFAVAQNSDDKSPAIASPDTTVTSVPKASGECPHTGGFWGDVGRIEGFTFQDTAYELVLRNGTVEVLLGTQPCTRVDEIVYFEEMRSRDNQDELPSESTCEQKPLVQFADNAGGPEYTLALFETAGGVSLFFEDRCNEPLGTVTLPPAAD